MNVNKFVASDASCYIFLCECRNEHDTPLSCAAKAGKHDIVAYLLTIKSVTAEGTAPDEVHSM